ncbi:MAG: hypothetical protein AB1487_02860 [Thermodesulfobacteriota bacterium]
MKKAIRFLSGLLLLAFTGCLGLPASLESNGVTRLTLLFSGNTQGALEPCG